MGGKATLEQLECVDRCARALIWSGVKETGWMGGWDRAVTGAGSRFVRASRRR